MVPRRNTVDRQCWIGGLIWRLGSKISTKLKCRRAKRNVTCVRLNTRIPATWKVIGMPWLRTSPPPTWRTAGAHKDRPSGIKAPPRRQRAGRTRKDRRKGGMLCEIVRIWHVGRARLWHCFEAGHLVQMVVAHHVFDGFADCPGIQSSMSSCHRDIAPEAFSQGEI